MGSDAIGPSHREGPSRLLYAFEGGPKRLQETERSVNERGTTSPWRVSAGNSVRLGFTRARSMPVWCPLRPLFQQMARAERRRQRFCQTKESLDPRTDFERVRGRTHCSFEGKETANRGRAARSGLGISRSAIRCQTTEVGFRTADKDVEI